MGFCEVLVISALQATLFVGLWTCSFPRYASVAQDVDTPSPLAYGSNVGIGDRIINSIPSRVDFLQCFFSYSSPNVFSDRSLTIARKRLGTHIGGDANQKSPALTRIKCTAKIDVTGALHKALHVCSCR